MFYCIVGKFVVPLQVARHVYLLACCWRHEPIQTHVAVFPSSQVCRSCWRMMWPNLDPVIRLAGLCSSIVNTSTVTKLPAICDYRTGWFNTLLWLWRRMTGCLVPDVSTPCRGLVFNGLKLRKNATWRSSLGERRPQLYRSESLKTQTLNIRDLFIFPYRVVVNMCANNLNLQTLDIFPTLNIYVSWNWHCKEQLFAWSSLTD